MKITLISQVELKNVHRNKILIQRYLIIFISLIVTLFLIFIYQYIRNYLQGPLDWEFALSSFIGGFVWFMFLVFNIVMLVKFLKIKIAKVLIFLAFSEVLDLPLYIILNILRMDEIINVLNLIDFTHTWKFVQFLLALYLLVMIKQQKQNPHHFGGAVGQKGTERNSLIKIFFNRLRRSR